MSWSKSTTILLKAFIFLIALMPLRHVEAQTCNDVQMDLIYTGSITINGNLAQCFEFRYVGNTNFLTAINSMSLQFQISSGTTGAYFVNGGIHPSLTLATYMWQIPAHTDIGSGPFGQWSTYRFEAIAGDLTTTANFSQANQPFLKLIVVSDDPVCIQGFDGHARFLIDGTSGQFRFCNLNSKIANLSACSSQPSTQTCGQIITNWDCTAPNPTTGYLHNVEVDFVNLITNTTCSDMSDIQGIFCCNAGQVGHQISIVPFEDDDPLCGVGDVDLDIIQKWVAHITTNNDPMRFLAADVNYDGKVNVLDILQIRLLVLGNIPIFSAKNNSWGFIDHETYVAIQNQISLFNIPSFNDYLNWTVGSSGIPMFNAYKLGDVDYSCIDCGFFTGNPINSRIQENPFEINSNIAENEGQYTLEFSIGRQEAIGLLSLEFSAEDIPYDLQIELHKREINPNSAYKIDRENQNIKILSILDGFEKLDKGEVICRISSSNRLFIENLNPHKFNLSTQDNFYENVRLTSHHKANKLRWVADHLEFSSTLDGLSIIHYYDLSGKEVFTQQIEVQKGKNFFPLPNNLNQGLFIARMTLNQSDHYTKIYR